MKNTIHHTAEVSPQATVGEGTIVWNFTQIREGAQIGKGCIIGRNVYIDFDVTVGNNCKIQNEAALYHGLTIADGVFIGPYACITNDKHPRAVNPDGSLKTADDWQVSATHIGEGASIGANATILPGVTIGKWAMIGAGSVVTRDVPDFALVVGNPARVMGKVNKQGERIT